ncbi:MAG: RHS repeat-associated core domain-containing protein, partial [Chlorobiales bacterium]|nr:RHS repeat-associated core domain-containing protein [Chlorobiales bacterium]
TNAVTTMYANNAVNEYTSIDSGGGAVAVQYDASGNLSRDESDFEYKYDYDNRLTKVSYDDGQNLTQVAHFEYDALGRLISSDLVFDSDVDGDTEALKYYYDGQEVLAEYDPSDNLSRRYIHGSRVDERAVLLEGVGANLDPYYYLLQDLQSVTGLVRKNGALVEANRYDAYGDVEVFGYHPYDVTRDDVVQTADLLATVDERDATGPGVATGDPTTDHDMDGDTDNDDVNLVSGAWASQTQNLRVSGVGNPYLFTGRRWHFFEDLNEAGTNPNRRVQYNRARHYDPVHGRWLQRDPAGYVDGMNLYEYVRSNPSTGVDPSGLWWWRDKYPCEDTGVWQWRGPWVDFHSFLHPHDTLSHTTPGQWLGLAEEIALWERSFSKVWKCKVECQCYMLYQLVEEGLPDPPDRISQYRQAGLSGSAST